MKTLYLIIILFLFSNLTNAQFFQEPVIKIKPFRYAIAWNPNLSAEVQIKGSRFTISQEFTYLLRIKETIGFESFPYVWCNGFQTITECRFYFDRKLKYPKGHYFSLQTGYTYSFIAKQDYFNIDGYLYTANTTIKYPEINIAIGKQVLLFTRLSLNFLVGARTELCYYRRLHVLQSYDYRELIGTNILDKKNTYSNLFCRFSIGIFLVKNKDNTKIKGNN
ncbi:MAG: hypothetical protein PHZ24_13515 [Bacteroidales bacterium]|nr:hypothetical protein [Bacteroidales bacterium]MDY0143311.1 hypothetical protein [Bacteroidales bacterium]